MLAEAVTILGAAVTIVRAVEATVDEAVTIV